MPLIMIDQKRPILKTISNDKHLGSSFELAIDGNYFISINEDTALCIISKFKHMMPAKKLIVRKIDSTLDSFLH